MTKWMWLLMAFHLGLVSASDNIEVGLLNDRAPYSDFNMWAQADGALPELLEQLSSPGQLYLTPKSMTSVTELESKLNRKSIRAALPPPFSIPPDGVLVSQPLLKQHWAIITRNNHLTVRNNHGLNLNQQRILLLKNSPAAPKLAALWPGIVLESDLTLSEALRLLNAGAADGFVCDAALADMLVHNLYPGLLQSTNIPGVSSNQSFWVSSGEETLLKEINTRIEALPPGVAATVATRWLLNAALRDIQPAGEQDNGVIDYFSVIVGSLLLFLVAFLLSQIIRRRRAERSLLNALTYWQTLLNSIPTPLLVCNPIGRITHCNQNMLTTLERDSSNVVGITFEEFMIHNPIIPPVGHKEWVAALSSRSPQFSDRSIFIHGENIEIVQWLVAYCDSRNVPQGLLIGWYDISDRKNLERRLEISSQEAINASKEKSEFLARMSHEIRSPMNAILGILELEQQKQRENEGSMLNIAYSASLQLLQIVGGVLDISKIEAGEMKLQLKESNLRLQLKQMLDTFIPLASQKGLKLESELDVHQDSRYRMDSVRLCQIVSNLLSNAIKYSDKGTVCLRVTCKGVGNDTDLLTFSVQDSGPGIPENLQKTILRPYVQLDPDSPASTGLGLAICVQFLKLMGSELSVNSIIGKGSVFSFSLKLNRIASEQPEAMTGGRSFATRALDILVVDDQTANLVVMKLQLETLGHRVTTCDNGKEALRILRTGYFDMLLTDCQMPVMTGYQLARNQRQSEIEGGGYLVMIGCTANAFNDEQYRCIEAGMDGVLIKPVTLQDLSQMLSEQQQIQLNMTEIYTIAAGQPQVIIQLIDEMQKSCESDRQQLTSLTSGNAEQFKAVLHRQKGSFALAGFQAGVELCQIMEKCLAVPEADRELALTLYCLQLNALMLRFKSLLSTEKKNRSH